MADERLRKYENIEELIDNHGQVTLGHTYPVGCIAVAGDQHNALAMLKRKPGESFTELLQRLDQAVGRAIEYEEFADEINQP